MFPYWLIRKLMKENEYVMTYFHIGDFLQNKGGLMSKSEYEEYLKEAGTLKNRLTRYVKSNLGTRNSYAKMEHLLKHDNFISINEADCIMSWSEASIVEI